MFNVAVDVVVYHCLNWVYRIEATEKGLWIDIDQKGVVLYEYGRWFLKMNSWWIWGRFGYLVGWIGWIILNTNMVNTKPIIYTYRYLFL